MNQPSSVTNRRRIRGIILALAASSLVILPMACSSQSHSRAATLIGAATVQTVTGWDSARSDIGPVATQRIFYKGALPARYAGSYCSALPARATCIISYKRPTVNVASYVTSVPSGRDVIFIFHHEPENDTFPGPGTNGQNFVSAFTVQSALIRSAARHAAHVKVAMAAETFQYQPGTRWDHGADCSYIPPARSVDYYFADIYEPRPDGRDLAHGPVRAQWNTWLGCVNAANKASPRTPATLGIAEYGLGTLAGNAAREKTMAADAAYLEATFTHFALWEYWWQNDSAAGGCTAASCDWKFTDAPTTKEWHALEAAQPG
jgi:hypothetical protein